MRDASRSLIMPNEEELPSTAAAADANATSAQSDVAGTGSPKAVAVTLDRLIQVERVTASEPYIGDLFRRRFGSDPPNYGQHHVALYKAARASFIAIGFVHYTVFDDNCLCGGMLADDRAYRRMPVAHQAMIRDAGGIVAIMLRETFARYADMPAVWAHVGDPAVREICLRAGFLPTSDRYVMVKWNGERSEPDKAAHLARVIALGPF